MKITKSELKEMIREVLKEELAKKPLKEEVDPLTQVLNELGAIELEYEGFNDDWFEDRFDPNSNYGHYQVTGSTGYNDFTYKVEAGDLFDFIEEYCLSEEKDSSKSPEVAEYLRLKNIYEATDFGTEESDEAFDAMNLYLAQNLEKFFEVYEKDVYDYFEEQAQEWARENL